MALAELESLFGDGRGEEALMTISQDGNEELAIRRQAIVSLGRLRSTAGRQLILNWIKDRDVGDAALHALRFYGSPEVSQAIIDGFSGLQTGHVSAAVATLCARVESAKQLLDAIENQRIDRDVVAAYEWRQLLALNDEQISAQVLRIWPQSQEWQDLAAQKERVAALLTPDGIKNADLLKGAALFQKNCANCHRLLGQGAEIGPDLTGGQRSNLNYLIDNIVSPSAEVATNYRASLFELSDGQVVVGVVLSQLPDRIVVQTKEGPSTLQREEIENRVESGNSLMPNGLLNPLSDQEVIDLLSFLKRAGYE